MWRRLGSRPGDERCWRMMFLDVWLALECDVGSTTSTYCCGPSSPANLFLLPKAACCSWAMVCQWLVVFSYCRSCGVLGPKRSDVMYTMAASSRVTVKRRTCRQDSKAERAGRCSGGVNTGKKTGRKTRQRVSKTAALKRSDGNGLKRAMEVERVLRTDWRAMRGCCRPPWELGRGWMLGDVPD
jgi:hypothetical protein